MRDYDLLKSSSKEVEGGLMWELIFFDRKDGIIRRHQVLEPLAFVDPEGAGVELDEEIELLKLEALKEDKDAV